MREVLRQLNVTPGVVGSLACGGRGDILAWEFPPHFAEPALKRAASVLAAESPLLEKLLARGGSLELSYAGGRVVVRPFASGRLVVLCAPAMNRQLLGLSLAQAARRLESAAAAPAPAPAAV